MKVLFIENAGIRSAGAFHSLIALIEKLKNYDVESFVALPDRAEGCELLLEKNISYIPMRACAYSQMISLSASKLEKIKMPLKDTIVKLEALRLARFVKEKNIDIIHENTSACYIGAYVAKLTGIKHIWHVREFMEEDFGATLWKKERALQMFNDSDAIIAISKAIRDKYRNSITDPNKIHLIYNGVDVQKFYVPQRKILDRDMIKAVCVGRVCEGKGQSLVVEAVGRLYQQTGILIQITLAGAYTKEMYKKILAIAADYGIADKVFFLGQCNNIMDIYKESDVLCMASKCEAFGRVTVEAMLAGCLVIGANSGGTKEIIKHYENGLLFEPEDATDLAEKLYLLESNRDRMKKIAKHGTDFALDKYDATINAKRVFELYQKVLM